jgi:hypothetical protein
VGDGAVVFEVRVMAAIRFRIGQEWWTRNGRLVQIAEIHQHSIVARFGDGRRNRTWLNPDGRRFKEAPSAWDLVEFAGPGDDADAEICEYMGVPYTKANADLIEQTALKILRELNPSITSDVVDEPAPKGGA